MAKVPNYGYSPSLVAAIIAAVLSTILLAIHLCRLIQTRTWFCIPNIIGALFEAVGFATRIFGHYKPEANIPFSAQTLLILLAPILFAATAYMFLGRIITATGCESYSIIRPKHLTKIFIGGDILCFLVQTLGAGTIVSAIRDLDMKKVDRGKKIIILGLVLQILVLGLFMVVGGLFHMQVRKRRASRPVSCNWNWELYMGSLYASSMLITLRSLFRFIEYAMGVDGYLMVNEWPLYAFDTIPMAIVLAIGCMWYLGVLLRDKNSRNPSEYHEMIAGKRRVAANSVQSGFIDVARV